MMLNGLEQVLKLIDTHERRREDIKSNLTCNKDKRFLIFDHIESNIFIYILNSSTCIFHNIQFLQN